MAFTVNKKAFRVLEFVKTESIVTVQRRFRIMYYTEPPTFLGVKAAGAYDRQPCHPMPITYKCLDSQPHVTL